ncbi:23S rRNA (adenine(2030)-N(6))-methyltransferase RlmJ [Acetobacter sp. AN02]|nr:23S rRNA (adenine(2030)-N(6))-methyltransferase RlmJ [Acetobacter sp. AN02]MDG6094732.1 23S rRNA (adenine(2030)-N(6))-methyltransferase RlmJ [Acetobacter sp. AN02]
MDTHAGTGRYRLDGEEAGRTGEWKDGIGRLLDISPEDPALAHWLGLVRNRGPQVYPGSPDIAAGMLRPQDRLVCCELHPEDAATLRRLFRGNPAVAVHERDGYGAIRALWPVRGFTRGLILMDPPFEKSDDFERLAEAVAEARRRLRGACVAIWYPVKHRTPVRSFFDRLRDQGERGLLATELLLRPPTDPSRLNGSGLLLINPPWKFDETARKITDTLARRLGNEESRGSVEWIVPE